MRQREVGVWDSRGPEDLRAAFELIREEFTRRTALPPETADPLSLAAARHVCGASGIRLTLVGDSGTGKTHLARALAEVIGAPFLRVPLELMAEVNWSGADLADWLERIPGASLLPRTRGVVLLDNLDSLRVNRSKYHSGSGSTADYRMGKQESLLALWDGEEVMGKAHERSTATLLVIAAGVLQGVDGSELSVDQLVGWGFEPSLAQRISASRTLRLRAPSGTRMLRTLAQVGEEEAEAIRSTGFPVSIVPETIAYLAEKLQEAEESVLVRGRACIRQGLERQLLRMLTRPDHRPELILSPDDIRVPVARSTGWIE